jgi:branched-chain amino acid aminotransferase
MPFAGTGSIWMNGSLVNWADAKIHVASHVIHYGSGVFEGARCYDTPKGAACFRLSEHVKRLFNSAKIYRMEYPLGVEGFTAAVLDTIRANAFQACYIRPVIYRGYGAPGVNPLGSPVEAAILCWEWGKYLGPEALEKGVDVRVSSWTRSAPNTFPTMAKSVANYASGQLIKMEAVLEGYTEGIALDVYGHVSEGSGENIFLVRDGVILTPPLHSSVLPGITRDSVMKIARDLGYEVREEVLQREALYIADELFFAGTAAEITPIRSVDKIVVGPGRCGPITKAIQTRFFDIVEGRAADSHNWLTYVYPGASGADTKIRERVVTG